MSSFACPTQARPTFRAKFPISPISSMAGLSLSLKYTKSQVTYMPRFFSVDGDAINSSHVNFEKSTLGAERQSAVSQRHYGAGNSLALHTQCPFTDPPRSVDGTISAIVSTYFPRDAKCAGKRAQCKTINDLCTRNTSFIDCKFPWITVDLRDVFFALWQLQLENESIFAGITSELGNRAAYN
jgi:hypothetical protein